jgi:SHS family lactate transporter-like MFS transporter
MSGVLQGSWSIGFLMSSLAYGLLYDHIGWRGLLIIGVLPALAVVWIRIYVKEPQVWVENRRIQREQRQEFRAPLLDIFRLRILPNTLMACLWMAASFVIYYSVYGMFATHLQKAFLASGFWGYVADVAGRRWAMIIPAAIGALVTPFYLLSESYAFVAGAFILQGAFLGAIYGQNPAYLSERFPTEVRATASGFCYHQGAIWAGFTGPVLTYFAASQPLGFTIPMLISTTGAAILFVVTLLFSPETRGKVLVPELTLVEQPAE